MLKFFYVGYLFKKLIIYNLVKFVATKKCMTTNFSPILLFLLDLGCEIRDLGINKNQDL
jgi:hypothetical protein